jgi:hypothetical protein
VAIDDLIGVLSTTMARFTTSCRPAPPGVADDTPGRDWGRIFPAKALGVVIQRAERSS